MREHSCLSGVNPRGRRALVSASVRPVFVVRRRVGVWPSRSACASRAFRPSGVVVGLTVDGINWLVVHKVDTRGGSSPASPVCDSHVVFVVRCPLRPFLLTDSQACAFLYALGSLPRAYYLWGSAQLVQGRSQSHVEGVLALNAFWWPLLGSCRQPLSPSSLRGIVGETAAPRA